MATAVALRAMAPRLDGLSAAERELLTEWPGRPVSAPPGGA